MSIDLLHEKIRKLKNPSMVDFSVGGDCIPPHILEEEGDFLCAWVRFCRELMAGLKGFVPAVRFPFGSFAILGPGGLTALGGLLTEAKELGFYVVLDGPEILSPWDAQGAAKAFFESDSWPCDGLVISPYIGSDAIRPFVSGCKEGTKALFAVVRSANKSAVELQDLITGSRHVHGAAADLVNRYGEGIYGKCGYSRVAAVASAGSPNSLRSLRSGYNRLFLLVDGLDYPSGNAKNCSYAFDRFGYGAVVCAGPDVTAAWKEAQSDGKDYVQQAVQAADRMKKNIIRYVTVL